MAKGATSLEIEISKLEVAVGELGLAIDLLISVLVRKGIISPQQSISIRGASRGAARGA